MEASNSEENVKLNKSMNNLIKDIQINYIPTNSDNDNNQTSLDKEIYEMGIGYIRIYITNTKNFIFISQTELNTFKNEFNTYNNPTNMISFRNKLIECNKKYNEMYEINKKKIYDQLKKTQKKKSKHDKNSFKKLKIKICPIIKQIKKNKGITDDIYDEISPNLLESEKFINQIINGVWDYYEDIDEAYNRYLYQNN